MRRGSLWLWLLLLWTPVGGGLRAQKGWRMVDATRAAAIDLSITSGTPQKKFLVETMTGGVCVLDYDGDGWPDLFWVNGSTRQSWKSGRGPSDHLYRNNHDGTFQDVTQAAGVKDSAWGMGCAAADFDNDGDTDLYVTNFGPNFLYLNQGDGTFKEIAARAGVADPQWGTGAAWGDYDRDGDLDLYLANYVDFSFEKPAGDPRFCSYRGVTVACGPRGLPGARDHLFRNNGDHTFTDVSLAAGVDDSEKLYGFEPVFTDIDLDGDLDIFVANDSTPNFLWINDGHGHYSDSALMAGTAYNQEGREQANMGVDVADYDQDGQLDLYSTNFSDDYNVLYHNSGRGYWTDETYAAKMGQITFRNLAFGTLFADFDNNGLLDLFVANGHIYPEVDRYHLGSSYRQANQLFQNQGKGLFREIGARLGSGLAIVKSSRGAALLDWDRDGDLDIAVSNMDDRVDLIRNDLPPGRHYLNVVLRGHQSNRQGIGARVEIQAGPIRQMQELHAGSSYLSTSEPVLHFGLDHQTRVNILRVVWPSGKVQELHDLAVDRTILLDEEGRHRL